MITTQEKAIQLMHIHIDHFLSDLINCNYEMSIMDLPISDHRVVKLSIELEEKIIKFKHKRNIFSIFQHNEFKKQKEEINSICECRTFKEFHIKLSE